MPNKKIPVRTRTPRASKETEHVDETGLSPDLSTLAVRVPISLLRSIRLRAALGAKSLDDFVREAIEELLRT
jgi:predicted HicB family RNase H-like nuclease